MKKNSNKDDQTENSETLSELWPKSSKFEKINTEKEILYRIILINTCKKYTSELSAFNTAT